MSATKQDSNVTGLRFAEEASIAVLPGSPIWYPLEPNGYNDFGGQLKLLSRNPINPSRQRKKGVITDLDASGGFGQDLTQNNLTRLLQGFLFADLREKATNIPMNGVAIVFSSVVASTKTYTLASGTVGSSFALNSLVFFSGFSNSGNNGLKRVTAVTATTVVVAETCVDAATPPATAKIQRVGQQFATATADMVVSGSYPRLTRASGAVDWTSFGLIPGEWVFIGGDSAGLKFVTAANNGFARVRAVGAAYVEFDKSATTLVAETGTALTVQMFFGNVLKNEDDPDLIVRRTYNLERTLGEDDDGTMSEYLVGAVPNELSLQIRQADKITMDLSFVATDHEQYDGSVDVKTGSRPDLVDAPAFNTSSDFSRIKLHTITAGNTNPNPLFAYLTELTLTVNNNVKPNKAIAVLGAFEVSAGSFVVSGSVTAYFAAIAAVQAVRNNNDVTLDFAIVKNNAGLVFDLPLIGLGDGRLKVEQDQPITLPLTTDAAEGSQGHTLLVNEFPYLPTLAQ